MTFAAGYPKSVPAPIAPRGWGHWECDTGYQYVFNCRSGNNFFSYRVVAFLDDTTRVGTPFFVHLFYHFLLFFFVVDSTKNRNYVSFHCVFHYVAG